MTKIIEKIKNCENNGEVFWSFEYFPPKTKSGVINLFKRIERMNLLGPEFIDVTWGAGGSTSDLTLEICITAQNVCCFCFNKRFMDWRLQCI
jgi:methylenetetrahydrofolate reductase (NADPH)